MARRRKSNLAYVSRNARSSRIARQQESSEDAEVRRIKQAERQANIRAAETLSQYHARLRDMAERMAYKRASVRRFSDAQHRHERRQIFARNTCKFFENCAFDYDPTLDYSNHSLIKIDHMNNACRYCGALKWKEETEGICCSREDPEVSMDVSSIPELPIITSTFTESPTVKGDSSSSLSYHHPTSSISSYNPSTIVESSHSITYDLCVVGAGMFGSAAARHASANVGVKVCLVGPEEPTPQEMHNTDIFGSYYDEGRIAMTLHSNSSQILTKNSIKKYRELEKLSGVNFYHPVGVLMIFKRNGFLVKKRMEIANTSKLPFVDLAYSDIFERRFPYMKLKIDDHPLLEDYGAGYINPRQMITAQKIVARSQGCDIVTDVVHEVKPLINGIHEIITENQGVIKAKRVLICTGAFTNFKNFPMPKLKFTISKESVALLKITFKEARRLSAMPSIVYYRPEEQFGAYCLPPILYPDGYHYLKIGHMDFGKAELLTTLEEIKNWYLSNGDPEKIKILSEFLIDMLPGLKYEEITEKTCVTSHSVTGLPFIDRVSPTVTIAVVGNGGGAQYSDEVGRIAATLSITGQWDSEIPKSLFQAIYQN